MSADADIFDWIRDHGSERLQKIVRLGLLGKSAAVYRDERLVRDRPGWRWLHDDDDVRDALNPTMASLNALEAARKTVHGSVGVPFVTDLVYLVTPTHKGPALMATFLGREIVRELEQNESRLEALVEKVYETLSNPHAARVAGVFLDEAHKSWLRERTRNLLAWLQGELR